MTHPRGTRPMTMVEKIVARHAATRDGAADAAGAAVGPGSFVRIRPRRVMTHDNTAAVMPKFVRLFEGLADDAAAEPAIAEPGRLLFCLDHDVQDLTPEKLGKHAKIGSFAARHGVRFHGAGEGIGHQLMLERGHVVPGALCVASDSHSNAYGALGALGAPVVRTDAAVLWATGETWWRVPPVVRVELVGELAPDAGGKDVIASLCAQTGTAALNTAVEFGGPGLASLPVTDRISICNMTTEWGAVACCMEADARTLAYLEGRRALGERGLDTPLPTPDELAADAEATRADPGADYAAVITADLSRIEPCVTGPDRVDAAEPLSAIEPRRVAIQKAYLLSCVSGRLEDLAAAAAVIGSRRVAPGVEFYVAAASAEVERDARAAGHWAALERAGAIALPPGCGPCIGLGRGTVAAGEVAISATNRNFPGRMGSREGSVYLASPAVVAASAVAGVIAGPERAREAANNERGGRDGGRAAIVVEAKGVGPGSGPAATLRAVPGDEPAVRTGAVIGRGLLVAEDGVSTDQIYAGAWTYREDMTAEQMAAVVFENLEPGLAAALERGRPYGWVVLAGTNFGCGSSREQAVTALKHAGVRAVVAERVNGTYLRNAINNGLLCLECPGLSAALRALADAPGVGRLGPGVEVDAAGGRLVLDPLGPSERALSLTPVPGFALEMIAAGGIEPWARGLIRDRLRPAGGRS